MENFEILKNKEKESAVSPKSCSELLKEFKQMGEKEKMPLGEKLEFRGVGNKDVYNPTAPFEVDGITYILGRVESRNRETDTQSMFFIKDGDVWIPAENTPIYKMQDPFFTKIGDEIIVGGVKTSPAPTPKNIDALTWKTIFYKGKNLNDLEKFAEGPEGMKGIRIKKLRNDKIAVFTRPWDIGTRKEDGVGGKIGYIEIDSLDELNNKKIINKAKIIEVLFTEEEWGGANELYLLDNNKIGVLGHKACFKDEKEKKKKDEKKEKCYYGITFVFDPESEQVLGEKIISTAECFGKGEAKREGLRDVFYPGGLKVKNNEVMLYGGIRDAEAGRKKVGNSLEELFS
ncbi:DUF1861 family protein [Candidatus Parcubacteria bacterium]|nr:DUF1861 family protein [Candidatus Parcubacteria bacterium]